MNKPKYKAGQEIYYKPLDFFGKIIRVDENINCISYWIEFPDRNRYIDESSNIEEV